MNLPREARHAPRKLVLCFDGTGNKFRGDDSDSNILKIFRCLDRQAGDQYHYYQPGIGTYVVSNSLSNTTLKARIRSWYLKAKDSAVGSSFDHHVVGGYRFLMRFYNPGDEIYFFGFSRGAYVARFLAEMIDYVGLLSHGNEELVAFAWKAFSQWQSRQSEQTEKQQAQRQEMYRFMKGFRETFSRPVKRIRFLGLFDTVNSVPRFETAWMQRSKFPYTARSSAKVIRHCVSIDERRAKFRQDLIYQGAIRKTRLDHHHPHPFHEMKHRARRPRSSQPGESKDPRGRQRSLAPPAEKTFRPRSRSRSRATDRSDRPRPRNSAAELEVVDDGDDSDDDEQDIDEIWFAGGHGDIGGGWEVPVDAKSASHVPLTYMIREAQKAGLSFDPVKLVEMGVAEAASGALDSSTSGQVYHADDGAPDILIESASPLESHGPLSPGSQHIDWEQPRDADAEEKHHHHHHHIGPFHHMIQKAHLARIHDSLEFASGLGKGQVITWNIMEYMPFRRMDLQPDGSWKPIRWPLPCGEVRDIPHAARIHGSVIRRMREDATYRPGNLIIGGGGRGLRRAPDSYGMGEWVCVQNSGDPVGEVWVRKGTQAEPQ
ncbi:hypothetical protein GGS23DRAFT_214755 [Durotheca rogersii]|uniref:uncharacterized protein n=1 Tax=Durotheca rogersii TaxID=419775 RepID=UPI00221FB2A7|nr:uncharacterized protein GGS23DRAFT_214755 [Durotheca rogersii]KAI5860868.1 hypothetical protein GGS23DRAFT_214755 [Durotheca rogersii]